MPLLLAEFAGKGEIGAGGAPLSFLGVRWDGLGPPKATREVLRAWLEERWAGKGFWRSCSAVPGAAFRLK